MKLSRSFYRGFSKAINLAVVPEYTNLPSFIIKFDVDIYSISETI